ncbi:hypothetical protein IHE61_25020 [Streptomyces sp. GKU 257-1]|nr:hypothetical protein [Streptomyces sp. GKU 257-1]
MLTAEARTGGEERAEVFVGLARRLQSLVHREIELIDRLENEIEDPDLLKNVFRVDHVATRTRRHAENLAVLGGATAHRRWTRPVSLSEALRSAVAEVEHYTRVQLVPPIEGTVHGQAVADVVHLLAELIENATVFSPPEAQVLVRTQRVAAGLAVEVEDRGPGMDPAAQQRLNTVLAEPGRTDVAELVRDGRIGLYSTSSPPWPGGTASSSNCRTTSTAGCRPSPSCRSVCWAAPANPPPVPGRRAHPAAPRHPRRPQRPAGGAGRSRLPVRGPPPGRERARGGRPPERRTARAVDPGPGRPPPPGPGPRVRERAPAPGPAARGPPRIRTRPPRLLRPRPASPPVHRRCGPPRTRRGPGPPHRPPVAATPRIRGRGRGPGPAARSAGPAAPLPFAPPSAPAEDPDGTQSTPGRPPLPRRDGQQRTAAEHDPAGRPRGEAAPPPTGRTDPERRPLRGRATRPAPADSRTRTRTRGQEPRRRPVGPAVPPLGTGATGEPGTARTRETPARRPTPDARRPTRTTCGARRPSRCRGSVTARRPARVPAPSG